MHINILTRDAGIDLSHLSGDAWAGVDHGVYLLLKSGVLPEFTYGDFDSITEVEKVYINRHVDISPVQPEKDETDLELALLDLAQKGYTSIDVYGATGGRLDHMIGNVHLLTHHELTHIRIRLIDSKNVLELLGAGSHAIHHQYGMTYVSFLPLYDNTALSLRELKYPLDNTPINIGSTLTISNEFQSEVAYVDTDKSVLMIQSTDKQE